MSSGFFVLTMEYLSWRDFVGTASKKDLSPGSLVFPFQKYLLFFFPLRPCSTCFQKGFSFIFGFPGVHCLSPFSRFFFYFSGRANTVSRRHSFSNFPFFSSLEGYSASVNVTSWIWRNTFIPFFSLCERATRILAGPGNFTVRGSLLSYAYTPRNVTLTRTVVLCDSTHCPRLPLTKLMLVPAFICSPQPFSPFFF